MKALLIAGALLVAPMLAHADCYGDENFKSCHDYETGNSYTIQRLGNITTMHGHNAQTGSHWDQTSQKIGDTTHHYGRAADGAYWSGTSSSKNGCVRHQGTDSKGRTYNKMVCDPGQWVDESWLRSPF